MSLGKVAGFRPRDPGLVQLFNLSLDATGADLSSLMELSIKHGLAQAREELIKKRDAANAAIQRLSEKSR
jgi:hypothetical protein